MSRGQLVTALSLQNYIGSDVPLLLLPTRRVVSVSGLLGIASREVVVARSGRRGSRNLTRYRDDAQVVVNGIISGADADETWSEWDAVNLAFAACVDTDRLLKWTAGSSVALQRNVRLTSIDEPLAVGPDIINYQVTLRGSDPNAYSQTLKTATAVPLGSSQGGGLVMPFTFPLRFNTPASTVAGFVNEGFISTPPVFTLQGYLLNPTIELNPGVAIYLNGTIAATDQLIIDIDARTILLNGANRRDMLDTINSTWFELPPGSGTVTLLATDFSSSAQLSMSWRDARN